MQIDFHHTVTYVIARYAGFPHDQASIIAYCSQYVDDANNSGTIKFSNGARYARVSSAHKMLDYRNFNELANHFVWIPFHFIPGNNGLPAGQNPAGSFVHKLICLPNSPIAQDVVKKCIQAKDDPYGLHRLGITMHVYADTWAHQQFVGITHKQNDISHITLDEDDETETFLTRLTDFFGDVFDKTKSAFIGDVFPLGHGSALSYPDRPYLKWSYRDSNDRKINRDNASLFTQAADEMCKVMRQFIKGDIADQAQGLTQDQRDTIEKYLRQITDENGEIRHKKWLTLIADGVFGFPAEKLEYIPKGEHSWKYQALGTTKTVDENHDVFPYNPSFLTSNWKLFHDALLAHRFTVIRNILPGYGICVA